MPAPRNQAFLEAWNEFPGRRFHVLGNHDMDRGFTREQTVAFNGMPDRYYAFDVGPVRNLVLDGNEPGGAATGYRRFIGTEQLAWLEGELTRADRPCLLFVHQPFDADHTGVSRTAARCGQSWSRRNGTSPEAWSRCSAVTCTWIIAREVNGVQHVQINSASYWWLSGRQPVGRLSHPRCTARIRI